MRKLSSKSIITNFTPNVILLVIFTLFLILVMSGMRVQSGTADLTIWFLLADIVFAVFVIGYPMLWVQLFGYTLGKNEIRIERGVINKSYDSIPYSRIQNVGIERSLLERMLGISTVNIQTAGSSKMGSAEGNIPGVGKYVAEKIREDIMSQVREDDSEET